MLPPCFLVLLIAFVGSATRDETQVGADPLQLDFTATGKQHIWNKGFAAAGVIDSVGEVDTTPAAQSSLMDSSREEGPHLASGSSGTSLTLVSQPSSDPYTSNGEDDSSPSAGKEIKGSGSEKYRYIKKLGAGGFGLVWSARQEGGDVVAIKTSTEKTKAKTEYDALEKCQGSKFVVRMFDHFKDNRDRYYIVLEWAEAGDLATALHDRAPIDKLSIAKDIVVALADLKKLKVAHLDLKPGNVLLWNSEGQWTAKLTDFGLAVLNIDQEKRKGEGTGAYASPEVFKPPFLGPEVDVWAFGVLLYEMFTGKRPYTYYEGQPDKNREERQNFPRRNHTAALESVPLELQAIIIRTQTFDSGARITIEQIRSSPWFQQASLSLQSRQSLPPSSSVVTSSLTPEEISHADLQATEMFAEMAQQARVDEVTGQINEAQFRRWAQTKEAPAEKVAELWGLMSQGGVLTLERMKAVNREQMELQASPNRDSRQALPSSSSASLTPVPEDLVEFFAPQMLDKLCAYFQGLVKTHGLVLGKQEVLKTNFKQAIPDMVQFLGKRSSPQEIEAYYTIFDKTDPQRGKVNLIEFLKGFQALERGEFEEKEREKARNVVVFDQRNFLNNDLASRMTKSVDMRNVTNGRRARAEQTRKQKFAGRDLSQKEALQQLVLSR